MLGAVMVAEHSSRGHQSQMTSSEGSVVVSGEAA
jgi:hypothetical protein